MRLRALVGAQKQSQLRSICLVGIFAGLSSVGALAEAAPSSRFLAYTDQQAIVARDNPEGIYPSSGFAQRPVVVPPRLFGDQPVVVANIAIAALDPAFVTTASCGERSATRWVLCLDAALTLAAADQLAMLAFVSAPVAAYTRTTRVAAYLRSVLAQSPERLDWVRITDQHLPVCAHACERVVVLEKSI